MNKTVTINLAGINFYMDEDAFKKLDNYLNAISASLHAESRAETMRDIEARIAELFLENTGHKHAVINLKNVQEIIAVMGQPEDFQVDDNLFEEDDNQETTSQRRKKLYRDIDRSKIGGVCMGLAHYFDISVFWIRLLFLILLIPTGSTVILAYIILWITMPAALTTAERLDMRGQKVNVDNIERQVREGFSSFKDSVQNADYSAIERFFIGLKDVLINTGLFLGKIIGILLIVISGLSLIAVVLSFLSAGTFSVFQAPWIDYIAAADIGLPFWLASLIVLVFIGIPLFFLFLLGLKLLIDRMKSIGFTARAVLLGIWVLSFFVIAGLGIRQATLRAFDAEVTQVQQLPKTESGPLHIALKETENNFNAVLSRDRFLIKRDPKGQKFIYTQNVELRIVPTKNRARLKIVKSASGKGYEDAQKTASKIIYNYAFKKDTLYMDNTFRTAIANNFKDQDLDLVLYVPNGRAFSVDENIFAENVPANYAGHQLEFSNDQLTCLNCGDKANTSNQDLNTKEKTGKASDSHNNAKESEWYQEKPINASDSKD